MLVIDGSFGEGGGQILRTSLALAALLGKEVKIVNIRAKRRNPGLRPQHLTAVRTLAKICNAKLKGAFPGSKTLVFKPSRIEDSSLVANIGTAGSISLLFQQIIPIALACNLKLRAFGGTHVSFAPTIHYMQNVTLYFLRKFGAELNINLLSLGYYPKGNGCAVLSSKPSFPLEPIEITEAGKLHTIKCFACSSGMPAKVSRELAVHAKHELAENLGVFEYIDSVFSDPDRKETIGMSIDLFACYDKSIIGTNAIGISGSKPESIAKKASLALISEINSLAPIDSHCVDQLIVFMALAAGESRIIGKLTEHARTNIYVTEKILGVNFNVREKGQLAEISVKGIAFTK